MFKRTVGWLLLWAAGLAVMGCTNPSAPSKNELPIHRLREVTDQAEVEKMAQSIFPGAKPLPGDVSWLGLEADGLEGVAFIPQHWLPTPTVKSTDMFVLMMSVPNEHKRFREPLMIKLREKVAAQSGHAWTKPALMTPFVLKPGGFDYLGQKVDSQTVNGTKAVEYWYELADKDRTLYFVAAGLPGFGAYFPNERLNQFLLQLSKVNISAPPAAPVTP